MTEQEKLLEDARRKFAPIFAHPDDIEKAAVEWVSHQDSTTKTQSAQRPEDLPSRDF